MTRGGAALSLRSTEPSAGPVDASESRRRRCRGGAGRDPRVRSPYDSGRQPGDGSPLGPVVHKLGQEVHGRTDVLAGGRLRPCEPQCRRPGARPERPFLAASAVSSKGYFAVPLGGESDRPTPDRSGAGIFPAKCCCSRDSDSRETPARTAPHVVSRFSLPTFATDDQASDSWGVRGTAAAPGAPLETSISSRVPWTAASAPRISVGPRRPMQPMRKEGDVVSLPG